MGDDSGGSDEEGEMLVTFCLSTRFGTYCFIKYFVTVCTKVLVTIPLLLSHWRSGSKALAQKQQDV
jgi:hypothetical protein